VVVRLAVRERVDAGLVGYPGVGIRPPAVHCVEDPVQHLIGVRPTEERDRVDPTSPDYVIRQAIAGQIVGERAADEVLDVRIAARIAVVGQRVDPGPPGVLRGVGLEADGDRSGRTLCVAGGIGAVPSSELVVPAQPDERVVAGVGEDPVGPVGSDQQVARTAGVLAADDVLEVRQRVRPRGQRVLRTGDTQIDADAVGCELIGREVGAASAIRCVVGRTARVERVRTVSAGEGVLPFVADEARRARPGRQRVIPASADQRHGRGTASVVGHWAGEPAAAACVHGVGPVHSLDEVQVLAVGDRDVVDVGVGVEVRADLIRTDGTEAILIGS
jgi:hypothetical protein